MLSTSVPEFAKIGVDVVRDGRPFRIAGIASRPEALQPDVIWLHANGFNALTYRNTLEPLAAQLNVLAIDQRGHGATPQDRSVEGKRDALDLRDDLLALLEVVARGRRVILAGHSLGGCVSLLAAAEAPARVRGLALFDPVVLSREVVDQAMRSEGQALSESTLAAKARGRRRTFGSRQEALDTYRQRSIFATWPDAALRDYVEAGFREAPGGGVELACAPEWEAANFAAHAHDTWAAMARVEAPVRIYRAEHGSTCTVADAAEFPRPAGQVEVETVPGATHFLPIERPELVREAILRLHRQT